MEIESHADDMWSLSRIINTHWQYKFFSQISVLTYDGRFCNQVLDMLSKFVKGFILQYKKLYQILYEFNMC